MYDWLIPIFFWFSTAGTTDWSPRDRQDYRMQLALNGSFETNSNAVNAEMIRFFLAGRYIDSSMKDRSLKRMKDNNRLGMDINAEISFFAKPDSGFGKNWSYGITFGQRLLFGGKFSKDAYKLGFYGNAPFAGQTLNAGGLNAAYLNYQYLSLGFVKEFKGQKWHKALGFGATYANANQFFSLKADRASLFTEETGQYLDADVNYEMKQNDASKNKFFYPNGFGVGGSLEFTMSDRKHHSFFIRATNIGFMRFNTFSSYRSLDTTLTFDGVHVDNALKVNGEYLNHTLDSLARDFGGNTGSRPAYMMMPGSISAGYTYAAIPEKLYITGMANYTFFPGYFPQFSVRVAGTPDPFVSVAGTFSYGGWGGFNGGVDLGFHFGEGWHLTIGTQTLQGIISERNTSGLSGRAGLIKRFGKSKNKK